ncbi:MAG TPA: hypothetical protein PKM12_07685, partial [Marmoricola sp.]|nr:hypothetical protein [Marmoricola sp.]
PQAAPVDPSVPPTVSQAPVVVDPRVGQPLTDDTPFGSPPKWVFQAQGGWSVDRMDGDTSQMTQVATGCHLTLQVRARSGQETDQQASTDAVAQLIGEVRGQFAEVSEVSRASLILRTLPTSKDPNTGIEFLRSQVDYDHATEPKEWSVVLGARAFVGDRVTLVLGYSCPRNQMGSRREVDRLLTATARINSE